jgi:S-adenosylmethionine synthetase
VREAQVYILSQIGHPLDQPLVATATVTPANGTSLSDSDRAAVEAVIDRQLADMVGLREKIANMEVTMY